MIMSLNVVLFVSIMQWAWGAWVIYANYNCCIFLFQVILGHQRVYSLHGRLYLTCWTLVQLISMSGFVVLLPFWGIKILLLRHCFKILHQSRLFIFTYVASVCLGCCCLIGYLPWGSLVCCAALAWGRAAYVTICFGDFSAHTFTGPNYL